MTIRPVLLTGHDAWLLREAALRELRVNRSLRKEDRARLQELSEGVLLPIINEACPVTIVDGPSPCEDRSGEIPDKPVQGE